MPHEGLRSSEDAPGFHQEKPKEESSQITEDQHKGWSGGPGDGAFIPTESPDEVLQQSCVENTQNEERERSP